MGSGGHLVRARTAEKLFQNQNHSSQVGREQGNKSFLFPPPTGCPTQKAEGKRAQMIWSLEISILGRRRVEHRPGRPMETTQCRSYEVAAGPGPRDRT